MKNWNYRLRTLGYGTFAGVLLLGFFEVLGEPDHQLLVRGFGNDLNTSVEKRISQALADQLVIIGNQDL